MNRQHPTTPRQALAFTLTELLTVISIIALLIALVVPCISSLTGSSRVEAGLNIVGMSADVARQWVRPSQWAPDSNDLVTSEQYNGTAALYCPTGEIRIVVNDRYAKRPNGNFLEDSEATPSPLATNGYRDARGVDYMQVPSGAGVVGVHRTGSTVRFIAPPFAIAFNENGQLNFGDADGRIYYDGNNDGRYATGNSRPNSYDPSAWDGREGSTNELTSDELSARLPFEAIECVSGVLVYNEEDFNGSGFAADLNNGGVVNRNTDAGNWLRENGRTLFFSPQTGIALRDEGD